MPMETNMLELSQISKKILILDGDFRHQQQSFEIFAQPFSFDAQ